MATRIAGTEPLENDVVRDGGKVSRASWLADRLPVAVLFVLLGGLGFLGHHYGWRLPKASTLFGGATEAAAKDWCDAHNVPESVCVVCNPDQFARPKSTGWCAAHGVPDCPTCHPQFAQVQGEPTLPSYDTVAALGVLSRPENNSVCKLHERVLQFASAEAAAKAGVDVDVAHEQPMLDEIPASGEATYDQTRVARLSSRVPGAAWRVFKQVGDRVRAGEVLALIDAAEVGKLKNELLGAIVQLQLKSKTLESLRPLGGVVSDRQIREAQAAVEETRIRFITARQALHNLGFRVPDDLENLDADQAATRLHFLGLPETLAASLGGRENTTANLFPLVSPLAGVVVTREVVAGEVVDASKLLFVVADVSRLWLDLSFRQEDARRLKLGLPVRFRPDDGGAEVVGAIDWLSTSIDPKTRTVKARAVLDNQDGRLRANTFGMGRAILREEPRAVVVPNEAVQWEGDCHVVFVRDKDYLKEGSPKVFHVRKVRLGAKNDRATEILAGVLPGEVVATNGAGVLRGELLRASLGEGCGCHE